MMEMFKKFSFTDKKVMNIGFVTSELATGNKLRDDIKARAGIDLDLIRTADIKPGLVLPEVDIFVFDLNTESKTAISDFDSFMRNRPQHIPVIVLSPAINNELVRWFLQLHVADWLAIPIATGELIAACGRVISQYAENSQDVNCLSFIGASGGAGATTLAISTALILKSASASSTCLVDLDLVSGACSDYLDLQASWDLDDLMEDPERLDSQIFDIMSNKHQSGVTVLSSQRAFADLLNFEPTIITATLDFASQKFTNLVIDLPRHAKAWTDSVIVGSNDVFIVAECTIPSLKLARRMADEMNERYSGEVQPRVIVNKYDRTLFGAGVSRHEVQKILQKYQFDLIPAKVSLVHEAIDRGLPLETVKPNNAISKKLRKVIEANSQALSIKTGMAK